MKGALKVFRKSFEAVDRAYRVDLDGVIAELLHFCGSVSWKRAA